MAHVSLLNGDALKRGTSTSDRAPDRMDLDKIVLAIVEIVDVETRAFHQHALDQFASRPTVGTTNLGRRAQQRERLLEFIDEKLLGVTMFTPPVVLRFELSLGFSENDDLHVALDAA